MGETNREIGEQRTGPERIGAALHRLVERFGSAIEIGKDASIEQPDAEAWEREAAQRGIPKRYWAASLVTGQATPAVEAVRRWLDSDAPSQGGALVLAGPTGVGKTFAAVGAMRAGPWGRFCYWPAICAAFLDQDRRPEVLAWLLKRRLVVLDDFGAEYLKEGGLVLALTDEVIWTREANQLATILTTNVVPEEMAERFSDRIADRLLGPWGQVAALPGESLRRRGERGADGYNKPLQEVIRNAPTHED